MIISPSHRPCVARMLLLTLVAFIELPTPQITRQSSAAAPPAVPPRTAWTTSQVTGSPAPPLPYVAQRAFPALKFNKCLDLTRAPGSDRLFIVEQDGKIFSFPNDPDVKTADLVVDITTAIPEAKQLYALAFHPNFAENGYCYICYIKAAGLPDGTQISRLTVSQTNPPTIDLASEQKIISWLSGGHNGCCLKFGPDGCLYISTGDAAPANPPDTLKAGQDVSNLMSSILRIDVDHTVGESNYLIPQDNPFVNLENARGEIWAYGFRNPWRMSFDGQTGDLWVGDVGWELWEMLDRVERGGNYGWSVREGNQSINPEWPRGPTPILPPTIEHPHSESSSITEGLTYYGARLANLSGTHLYGDFDTGKIWGFRYVDGKVVDHRELADTTIRIVGFGEDHHGEFFLVDHSAGTLHQLVANPAQDRTSEFPRKLSQTGLFSSVVAQTPAPGVIPYSINAEPWADHAISARFVAVPGTLSVKPAGISWAFPKDSVLVKTLSLDIEQGKPQSRRRVETQILHFDGSEWQPYTYQWNDAQSDASLVEATGTEQRFTIVDPAGPGGKRTQTWRFAGRAECQRCHNKWSGPVLAFNTPQLNREHHHGDTPGNQLELLAQMSLLATPVPAENRPQLATPSDPEANLTDRARAYLQVNCAHCHRMHAGSAVLSLMHYDLALKDTKMVGIRPSQGTFGIHAAQVIAPGDPFRSVLLYRMSKLGRGRMPYLGSTEVDLNGVQLMSQWLKTVAPISDSTSPSDTTATNLRQVEQQRLTQLLAPAPQPQQKQLVQDLLSSTSGALQVLQALDDGALNEDTAKLALGAATSHEDVRIRDLFERFLPAEQRVKRLGSVVQVDQLLALPGDPNRGQKLFLNTAGIACKNCHRIGKQGQEVGPDLSMIGKKYSPAQLLESILQPSKRIDPKYVTYLAETDEGRLLTGLLVKKDANEIVLRDAQNKLLKIPADQVEELVPQGKSLMPELLLRDLTAQQVADLLAYLGSLK